MTPEQAQALRTLLISALFDTGRPAYEYPYQRGFNEGVTLAIRQIDKVLKGDTE